MSEELVEARFANVADIIKFKLHYKYKTYNVIGIVMEIATLSDHRHIKLLSCPDDEKMLITLENVFYYNGYISLYRSKISIIQKYAINVVTEDGNYND